MKILFASAIMAVLSIASGTTIASVSAVLLLGPLCCARTTCLHPAVCCVYVYALANNMPTHPSPVIISLTHTSPTTTVHRRRLSRHYSGEQESRRPTFSSWINLGRRFHYRRGQLLRRACWRELPSWLPVLQWPEGYIHRKH